jgi:hypothetical protein
MKVSWGELDTNFCIDMVVGIIMLLVGIFFDPIAKHFTWTHAEGFSTGQVLWVGFWGIWIVFKSVYWWAYGRN